MENCMSLSGWETYVRGCDIPFDRYIAEKYIRVGLNVSPKKSGRKNIYNKYDIRTIMDCQLYISPDTNDRKQLKQVVAMVNHINDNLNELVVPVEFSNVKDEFTLLLIGRKLSQEVVDKDTIGVLVKKLQHDPIEIYLDPWADHILSDVIKYITSSDSSTNKIRDALIIGARYNFNKYLMNRLIEVYSLPKVYNSRILLGVLAVL